ncbi:MAG: acetate/propionate family kinase [Limisphaerales bacterium]
MKILVANLGSTSLKYRLFDFSGGEERMVTRGGVERVTDYAGAIDSCLGELLAGSFIRNESDLAAVGFKTIMARGLNGCRLLDEDVVRRMEECNAIAPAHNPPYIMGLRLFARRMPKVPLVGLFETAFYQWAPEAAMRYAVPESWYEAGVRRWGFHGASHKFVAERSAELLGREDVAERARQLYVDCGKSPVRSPALRVISCHFGGSSSVTGIRDGVAIGTSMGLSPQSGLPQNNRVGDLDSFAIPYMTRTTGITAEEAERQLCKESGLKALSGGYTDFRDIAAQAAQGNARAQLALDVFIDNARHWIGAFYLKLNGLDALVFTAGIGEHNPELRTAICRDLDQLGIVLDAKRNAHAHANETVSAPEARVKIMVIPTNEELVVAREVRRFLQTN